MTKQQTERTIRAEINFLNQVIDQKIIKGLSYKKEARQHKLLLAKLSHVRMSYFTEKNWFGRSVRLALSSAFLL